MKAVKGNKVYTVDDTTKKRYINDGFDILDDEGNVVVHGKGKKVTYEEHQAVLKELEALKAAQANAQLAEMSVEELRAYAEQKGIDIGQASTQAGILKKIEEYEKEGA